MLSPLVPNNFRLTRVVKFNLKCKILNDELFRSGKSLTKNTAEYNDQRP